ncbi:hypothetical protein Q1695_004622 [Nippostrongylus brasiliensis]|nr:hypothetical protein Q1695_004622 [Nippostrongylus brasiliensis]
MQNIATPPTYTTTHVESGKETVSDELWAEVEEMVLGKGDSEEQEQETNEDDFLLQPKCETCLKYRSIFYTSITCASSTANKMDDLLGVQMELSSLKKQLLDNEVQLKALKQAEIDHSSRIDIAQDAAVKWVQNWRETMKKIYDFIGIVAKTQEHEDEGDTELKKEDVMEEEKMDVERETTSLACVTVKKDNSRDGSRTSMKTPNKMVVTPTKAFTSPALLENEVSSPSKFSQLETELRDGVMMLRHMLAHRTDGGQKASDLGMDDSQPSAGATPSKGTHERSDEQPQEVPIDTVHVCTAFIAPSNIQQIAEKEIDEADELPNQAEAGLTECAEDSKDECKGNVLSSSNTTADEMVPSMDQVSKEAAGKSPSLSKKRKTAAVDTRAPKSSRKSEDAFEGTSPQKRTRSSKAEKAQSPKQQKGKASKTCRSSALKDRKSTSARFKR